MNTVMEAPICRTQICKRPCTYLEKSNTWRCLVCNPLPKVISAPDQNQHKYVDVKPDEKRVKEMIESSISEDRIREIVQDELANWHIQRPPVTRDEIASTNNVPVEQNVETWRQKAKRLGVKTHNAGTGGMRKKIDILAEIEAKEQKESTSVDETTRP